MLVRFGLKIGNVKIGSMFLYILHGVIVKHGQRFIHTASSVNPTIVQKGARMWHILMPKSTHRAAFHSLLPISPVQKAVPSFTIYSFTSRVYFLPHSSTFSIISRTQQKTTRIGPRTRSRMAVPPGFPHARSRMGVPPGFPHTRSRMGIPHGASHGFPARLLYPRGRVRRCSSFKCETDTCV